MLKSFFTFLIVIVLTVICTTVILVARIFYRMHRHAKQFFRQAGDAMNGQRNTSQRTQQHTSQGSSVMSDGETIMTSAIPKPPTERSSSVARENTSTSRKRNKRSFTPSSVAFPLTRKCSLMIPNANNRSLDFLANIELH